MNIRCKLCPGALHCLQGTVTHCDSFETHNGAGSTLPDKSGVTEGAARWCTGTPQNTGKEGAIKEETRVSGPSGDVTKEHHPPIHPPVNYCSDSGVC